MFNFIRQHCCVYVLVSFLLLSIIFCVVYPNCSYAATTACGDLDNGENGPFDYWDPERRERLKLVEKFHFTPKVESLFSGESGYISGDLDYTLRAFPNHPRALYSVSRYERQQMKKAQDDKKSSQPQIAQLLSSGGWPRSAECYFDRAMRWRPNDPTVRLIYGIHLHLTGKLPQALEQYKLSERIQPKSADLNYNMGLLYFDIKQYALAKEYAKRAYQLGYPLPGLRKKLAGVGQWP